MNHLRSVLITAFLLILTGCHESGKTIPAVTPFSLEKFMGIWHEAARMPHWFEKDMEYVTAEYRLLPNGTVQVLNRGFRNGKMKSIKGIARQKNKDSGELEVSFWRPFYSDYRIIALNEDYTAALITSSSKDYAWILVKNPELSGKYIPEYISLLGEWGFDCKKLILPKMHK